MRFSLAILFCMLLPLAYASSITGQINFSHSTPIYKHHSLSVAFRNLEHSSVLFEGAILHFDLSQLNRQVTIRISLCHADPSTGFPYHASHTALEPMMCIERQKALLDPSSSPTLLWKSNLNPELRMGVLYTIICESTMRDDKHAVRWRSSMNSIAIAALSNWDHSWEMASLENGAFSTSIVASMM